MNIILILLVILFILMALIGRQRGIKSFFTLIFNFFTLFFMLLLILGKVDPIKVTLMGSILITYTTLFYINGFNRKTVSSLLSVTIVIILTMLLTSKMGTNAQIQGFGNEQSDIVAYLSLYVQLNFSKIVICEILIGLLGAIIDVSISISSAMNEVYRSTPISNQKDLFISGMNIGKDILGTMTNTLLFAYISGFMTLIIYFKEQHYTLATIINAKVFCSEIFQVISCGIGVLLIIPITALISSKVLTLPIKERETE